jgi:catechol 2,3-dioxygenase-like lactoylglutathione lyase family enzyme
MLNRLDHVGVIVPDLAAAKQFLGETLGLELVRELDARDERGLMAAFFRLGDVNIEVIEVTEPEQRARRLGPDGAARIEHLAVAVDDVAGAMSELHRQGVETTTPEPFLLGGRQTVFTRPEASGGVQYQLVPDPASAQPPA